MLVLEKGTQQGDLSTAPLLFQARGAEAHPTCPSHVVTRHADTPPDPSVTL